MLGDLFDSPWKILIIAVVVLVLFGSRKLPEAARSLGRSMRILKAEIKDLHEDDATGTSPDAQPVRQPQQLTPPAPVVSTPMAAPVSTPVASVPVPPEQQVAAPVTTPVASAPVAEAPRDTTAS